VTSLLNDITLTTRRVCDAFHPPVCMAILIQTPQSTVCITILMACVPCHELYPACCAAEVDLLMAASTCPQGDVSVACGTGKAPQCYPLGVEVYQPSEEYLAGWVPPEPVKYTGRHGMPLGSDGQR
jgi:hypothetical protein